MASQPVMPPAGPNSESEDEKRLSYDEGWDLIISLFGSAREMYASVGGSDAFMRAERDAWDEDDLG